MQVSSAERWVYIVTTTSFHSTIVVSTRMATLKPLPLPTKIKEIMRAGAIGRYELRESGQECHFSLFWGGPISPNRENPNILLRENSFGPEIS